MELLHLLPKALPKGKISAQETYSLFLPPSLKIRVTVAFTLKSIKKTLNSQSVACVFPIKKAVPD